LIQLTTGVLSRSQKSTFFPDGFPLVSVPVGVLESRSGSRASAILPESLVGAGTGIARCLRWLGLHATEHWLAAGLARGCYFSAPLSLLIHMGTSPARVKHRHPQARSWGSPSPPATQLQTPQQTSRKAGSGGKHPRCSGHAEVFRSAL